MKVLILSTHLASISQTLGPSNHPAGSPLCSHLMVRGHPTGPATVGFQVWAAAQRSDGRGPRAPGAFLCSRQNQTNAHWQPRLTWLSNERTRGVDVWETTRCRVAEASEGHRRMMNETEASAAPLRSAPVSGVGHARWTIHRPLNGTTVLVQLNELPFPPKLMWFHVYLELAHISGMEFIQH